MVLENDNRIFKENRKEFSNKYFREILEKEKEYICVNCEDTKSLEYHHIVPLANGGTNKLSNIVMLCEECHFAAHNKKRFKPRNAGRPASYTYNNIEHILKDYFECNISKTEAVEKIGITKGSKSTWTRAIGEYKEKHKISEYRNNIDVILSNNRISLKDKYREDRRIGYLRYKNGDLYLFNWGNRNKPIK